MTRKYVRDNRGRFASVGATGRGGRLKTASGKKRATQTMKASGGQRAGAIRGKVKRDPAAAGKIGKANARPTYKKVDLSQSGFERKAAMTEKRARQAEKLVEGVDRGYASRSSRRMIRTADALRSAADSYQSYARRGKTGEFSAGYLFNAEKKSSRRSTVPKLTRAEKAAETRRVNKAKRNEEQRRRAEQARRYG